jgi:hypothetical protein
VPADDNLVAQLSRRIFRHIPFTSNYRPSYTSCQHMLTGGALISQHTDATVYHPTPLALLSGSRVNFVICSQSAALSFVSSQAAMRSLVRVVPSSHEIAWKVPYN